MELTWGEIYGALGKREEEEGRGGLHRGWSWREERDLQLPVVGGDGVAAGEAHSWCRGAGGRGVRARRRLHIARGVSWRLKVDGINIKIASFWQLKKTITNNWTIWFVGRTVGSTDSILIQPLFGSIDRIGLEPWPSNGQTGPIRFLKP